MKRPNHDFFENALDLHNAGDGDIEEVTARDIQLLIERRKMRGRYLPSCLFSEPGWEMLLFLALRKLEQRRATIRETCNATTAPYSTAWRWLERLMKEGLIAQKDDPLDARRKFVELTPDALTRVSITVKSRQQLAT